MKPRLCALPFQRRQELPAASGIYFLIADGVIVYVGLSNNIGHRWQQHHNLPKCFKMEKDGKALFLVWFEAEEQHLEEAELCITSRIKPSLNKTKVIPEAAHLRGSGCGGYLDEHSDNCPACAESLELEQELEQIYAGARDIADALADRWGYSFPNRMNDDARLSHLAQLIPAVAKPKLKRTAAIKQRLLHLEAEEKRRHQRIRIPTLGFDFTIDDVLAVQDQAGHSSPLTTKGYDLRGKKAQRNVASKCSIPL